MPTPPQPIADPNPTPAAFKAAAKGFVCVWLILSLASTISSREVPDHTPLKDRVAIFFIYFFATGIVTFLTVIFLVLPYLFTMKTESLLRRPWRLYIESGLLALVGALVITPLIKAPVDTFAQTLVPLLAFAFGVSLLASFFYLRDIKRAHARSPANNQDLV